VEFTLTANRGSGTEMTKGELLLALDGASDEAEVLLLVDGRDLALDGVDITYTGFCDPTYTVRLRGTSPTGGSGG
jgi:hypothetical protein